MDQFELIAQDERVADALNFPFEIEIEDEYDEWVRIEGTQYRVVAGDGGGNQYVRLTDGSIAFISHESHAGVIAADTQEFFELVVNAPYWRDLLKFSGGGELSEMRRVQPLLEQGLEADDLEEDFYEPGDKVADRRPFLRQKLGLADDVDVVARLHAAVTGSLSMRFIAYARDGEPEFDLLPLFGDFVLEDNPMWADDEGDEEEASADRHDDTL